ncbi:hypothetical protein T440DRAFT_466920 [Plenodomus tracheiphilus IPT5]|uniref:Uncharacterized protein n=1 Tax=Plenodomus tracheiphilus IPT5 TaxID=1408161 RepID=A0A6A7B9X3_9PLEO|nr:hypothetical protein T440DRAFT_466920 [Plenodomus tracheiphilus IPT5]
MLGMQLSGLGLGPLICWRCVGHFIAFGRNGVIYCLELGWGGAARCVVGPWGHGLAQVCAWFGLVVQEWAAAKCVVSR